MPSRKSSFGVISSGNQIGIIVGIIVLVVVGIVIFMMYKPASAYFTSSTISPQQAAFVGRFQASMQRAAARQKAADVAVPKKPKYAMIEYYSNQIWTSEVTPLTNNRSDWTQMKSVNSIAFKCLTPLNNGKYAAVEYYTNQIWTSDTLTSDKAEWTLLTLNKEGVEYNRDIGFKWLIQCKDGLYVCIEWTTNQIWSSSVLSNKRSDWTRMDYAYTGIYKFNTIKQLSNGAFMGSSVGMNGPNKLSNQIWRLGNIDSPTYVNYIDTPPTSFNSADWGGFAMQVKDVSQLYDGTYAAVEYYTNQIWTASTLTGNKDQWKQAKNTPEAIACRQILQIQ